MKPKKVLTENAVNLKENAPVGSFEYVREKIQEELKRQIYVLFPNVVTADYGYYLLYAYPERVICDVKGKYYEIPYSMDSNYKISFGNPVEVEQYYAPKELQETTKKKEEVKEGLSKELKESGITITKEGVDQNAIFTDFISLQEAKYDENSGVLEEVILIEAGTNPMKKRHYPKATIQEAAGKFTGLKMYINHATTKEENERPERNLKDWASTIVESWYDDGKAMAKVAVHDDWLRERLKDPVARKHIGLSINAGGKVAYGKVNGQDMQIVEKIILEKQNGLASVDWVTEAGARGRMSRLLKESKGHKTMEIQEATFADLVRENPKLVNDLKESIKKELKESAETALNDKKLKDLQEENLRLKEAGIKLAQASKVAEWLKESKSLPEITKNRIAEEMASVVFENDTKLRESFEGKLKRELEYLNQLSTKGKIKLGSGKEDKETSLVESAESDLMERFHLNEKQEESKDK